MDPNNNRFHLNLPGAGSYNNERNYAASNARVYPTTPSTFPQPVFQNQGPQQQTNDYMGSQMQAHQSPNPGYGGGGGGGYFGSNNDLYRSQYAHPPQGQYQNQYQQQNLSSPQPSFQQRQPGYSPNDPNSGLAHQLSNQNLGGAQRQASSFVRQPSPVSRPRTGGAQQQQGYGNHLMPSSSTSNLSNLSGSTVAVNDEPPEKNPEKYSVNVGKRGQGLHVIVEDFFKQNITRARDRNVRSVYDPKSFAPNWDLYANLFAKNSAKDLEDYLSTTKDNDFAKRKTCEKHYKSEAQFLRHLRTIEKPENFVTKKIIGKGAFGEVKLVQRKRDGRIYALKSLVKTEMFKKDQLAHVRAERDILAESDSPWVVKLETTFQDNAYLYMLMEFLPGGDLMTMLIKYEIFSEDITRFYMAEIVLAIEAVHKLGYVHRDIKPDNILLDSKGHIKLTDFGLSTGFHAQHENSYYQQLLKGPSKPKDNRHSIALDQINLTVSNRGQINNWRKSRRVMAYSTVGTPDYIAPEIFGGQGYSFSCDWWSVGAIMFECLIGWPPFCAEDSRETYEKIINWRHTLYFPDDVQLGARAENLIKSLLCDPPQRLGTSYGAAGSTEIRSHPFFQGVIFEQLRNIRAPFEPRLSSNVDVSYFPTDEIDQNDHSALHRAQVEQLGEEHVAEMNLPFIGYTYKRFDAFK